MFLEKNETFPPERFHPLLTLLLGRDGIAKPIIGGNSNIVFLENDFF